MQNYGIDGAAVQNFVERLGFANTAARDSLTVVAAAKAAEHFGRVWYAEYDFSSSGVSATELSNRVITNWKKLVDAGYTAKASYLHDSGLPVVQLYGIAVGQNLMKPADWTKLINWFKKDSPTKYRATVIGAATWEWLFGNMTKPKTGWESPIEALDMVTSWSVGCCGSKGQTDGAQWWRDNIDVVQAKWLKTHGQRYMSTINPGSSGQNIGLANLGANPFRRNCGATYWEQAVDSVAAGADTIFVAMFDEVDESTAMYKVTSKTGLYPKSSNIFGLDVDGCDLKSDYYLRLGAATNGLFTGRTPLSYKLPIELAPGESLNGFDFTQGLTDSLIPNP